MAETARSENLTGSAAMWQNAVNQLNAQTELDKEQQEPDSSVKTLRRNEDGTPTAGYTNEGNLSQLVFGEDLQEDLPNKVEDESMTDPVSEQVPFDRQEALRTLQERGGSDQIRIIPGDKDPGKLYAQYNVDGVYSVAKNEDIQKALAGETIELPENVAVLMSREEMLQEIEKRGGSDLLRITKSDKNHKHYAQYNIDGINATATNDDLRNILLGKGVDLEKREEKVIDSIEQAKTRVVPTAESPITQEEKELMDKLVASAPINPYYEGDAPIGQEASPIESNEITQDVSPVVAENGQPEAVSIESGAETIVNNESPQYPTHDDYDRELSTTYVAPEPKEDIVDVSAEAASESSQKKPQRLEQRPKVTEVIESPEEEKKEGFFSKARNAIANAIKNEAEAAQRLGPAYPLRKLKDAGRMFQKAGENLADKAKNLITNEESNTAVLAVAAGAVMLKSMGDFADAVATNPSVFMTAFMRGGGEMMNAFMPDLEIADSSIETSGFDLEQSAEGLRSMFSPEVPEEWGGMEWGEVPPGVEMSGDTIDYNSTFTLQYEDITAPIYNQQAIPEGNGVVGPNALMYAAWSEENLASLNAPAAIVEAFNGIGKENAMKLGQDAFAMVDSKILAQELNYEFDSFATDDELARYLGENPEYMERASELTSVAFAEALPDAKMVELPAGYYANHYAASANDADGMALRHIVTREDGTEVLRVTNFAGEEVDFKPGCGQRVEAVPPSEAPPAVPPGEPPVVPPETPETPEEPPVVPPEEPEIPEEPSLDEKNPEEDVNVKDPDYDKEEPNEVSPIHEDEVSEGERAGNEADDAVVAPPVYVPPEPSPPVQTQPTNPATGEPLAPGANIDPTYPGRVDEVSPPTSSETVTGTIER